MSVKKINAGIIGCLILSACGSDNSPSETPSKVPTELPEVGNITSDELYSSSVSKDGYDSMVISKDSVLTLNTDELTLSKSQNGEPQKLTISGYLTIEK